MKNKLIEQSTMVTCYKLILSMYSLCFINQQSMHHVCMYLSLLAELRLISKRLKAALESLAHGLNGELITP
jgi:hypothetical protein